MELRQICKDFLFMARRRVAENLVLGIVDFDFGIDTHDFDLNHFSKRVYDLFQWYENDNEKKTFMAPYFALVQSSGMGKTKLLFEFKNCLDKSKYSCYMIQCKQWSHYFEKVDRKKEENVFNHLLLVGAKICKS